MSGVHGVVLLAYYCLVASSTSQLPDSRKATLVSAPCLRERDKTREMTRESEPPLPTMCPHAHAQPALQGRRPPVCKGRPGSLRAHLELRHYEPRCWQSHLTDHTFRLQPPDKTNTRSIPLSPCLTADINYIAGAFVKNLMRQRFF